MFRILGKSHKASSLLPHSLAPSYLSNLLFPLPSLFPQQAFRFITNPPKQKKSIIPLPPRPKPPPEHEFEESYVKGTGPGGQKINKTNSAVQLRHLATGIVVKCQETRSRSENRKIARRILAAKLDDMMNGEESRNAKVGEVRRKKKSSAAKKKRRKYRKLAEGKESEQDQDEDEEGEEEEGDEEETATRDELIEATGTPMETGNKEKGGIGKQKKYGPPETVKEAAK